MNRNQKKEFKEQFEEVVKRGIKEYGNPNDVDKEFMKKHPVYFWCIVFPAILLPIMVFIVLWTIFTVGTGIVQYNPIPGLIIIVLYFVGFVGGFFIDLGIYGIVSPLFSAFIPDYSESGDDYFVRKYKVKLIMIGLGICVVCGGIIRLLAKI